MILFIVVLAILLPIAIVIFILQQKAQTPYRILVLGPSGAGKTVFLASMYYKLSTLNPETGFFLVQVETLRKYLDLLKNPAEADFSTPTLLREVTEWDFICKVRGADGIHPLMSFSYYDYAGERIKLLFNTQNYTPEFRKVINKANVLLAMLDGQEILKLMRKEENNFEKDFVDDILPILTDREQPVHFIITKWDLLQKQYSLGAVRSRLMESSKGFRDFVHEQRKFGTLRLIPVSAVGLNFADLGPDGRMVKKLGSKFEPYQVEMPLVSVIFDQLDYASKKVGFMYQAWFSQLTRNGVVSGPIMQFIIFVAWVATAVTVNVGIFALNPAVFIAGVVNRFRGNAIVPPVLAGSGKLAAAKQVIERTAKLLRKLEKEFPESNLTTFKEKAHS